MDTQDYTVGGGGNFNQILIKETPTHATATSSLWLLRRPKLTFFTEVKFNV